MDRNVFCIENVLYLDIGLLHYMGECIEYVVAPTEVYPFWRIRFKSKQVIYTTEKVILCFKGE